MMFRLFCLVLITASSNGFTPTLESTTTKTCINSPVSSGVVPTSSSTQMNAMLTQTELPQKLYFEKEKELPKVLGGLKIGLRKLVVITGASSGLGLNAAATLAKTGRYFVVMAVRDIEKAKKGAYSQHLSRNCIFKHYNLTLVSALSCKKNGYA